VTPQLPIQTTKFFIVFWCALAPPHLEKGFSTVWGTATWPRDKWLRHRLAANAPIKLSSSPPRSYFHAWGMSLTGR